MDFMVDFMVIQWEFRLKSPWNHHEITKLCGLHLNPFWQGGKADEGETSFSEVSCCCVIWILQKVYESIKGYDLYDYSHISKSYVDDHLWL